MEVLNRMVELELENMELKLERLEFESKLEKEAINLKYKADMYKGFAWFYGVIGAAFAVLAACAVIF